LGKKILIIGGVALGPKAASRARRRDPDAEITIVERGDLFSYAGCGMPFYIEGAIDDIQNLLCTPLGVRRDEAYFESVKDVKILGRTEAQRINREEKTVTVEDLDTGETFDLPYDKLVLGVGAHAFMPPIEGMKLDGVYRLYNPHDAQAIRERLDMGVKDIAIVGGGLIGLEVCGAFHSRGCNVTILEMMGQLVPTLLDDDMALLLGNYLEEEGIRLELGNSATGILDNGEGRVSGVETADGKRIPAEMVIVAVGVRPNIELAREAGLEIGVTGAIKVNEHLQTSDPDIYAGGDCVENKSLITGEECYTPLGSTANKHGRIIGDNVTGGKTTFPGITGTVVFKVLNYNVGKTGINEGEAEELGYDVVTSLTPRGDCANYYPTALPFTVKLIADKNTKKALGAQTLGPGEAIKRIDVVATCLRFGGTLKDIADLDLGYAPPYSTAIDPVAHAANVIRNKMDGLAHGINAEEVKEKLDSGVEFILLDVRSPMEVEETPFTYPQVVNIPVSQLRTHMDELPQDEEIIIFCRSSVRAYEAERILRGAGYGDVKFLEGSLAAWPYPL
jgi:NADPH-dependent 2,4-dienoyl-CoA reductase/sulfur reductase-like enzyme/rhodanese-related sulfurtransferase